jgi:hypothetical protein
VGKIARIQVFTWSKLVKMTSHPANGNAWAQLAKNAVGRKVLPAAESGNAAVI